jgi:hypothetical protein
MECTLQGSNPSGNKRFFSFSKMLKLVLGPNAVSYSMDMGFLSQWWGGGEE